MSSVHLLVLIHGMWGNPNHLAELDRIIRETKSSADDLELHVLLAQTNRDESTYDGIDWGGERVAQEVADEVETLESKGKKVTRFSVTGYSLGGLVARYVLGILHQRDFFETVTPVNFSTVATPHLGLPRYPSFISSALSHLGPKLLSRTGEQFYCVDQWSTSGKPLIEVMADPERIFYQALALFAHIRIYANAINDITVPYVTSAIETEDPFADHAVNGIEVELEEDYSPLVKSYAVPLVPPTPTPKPVVLSPNWFRGLKPDPPLLPPFLQFRFPLNILLYSLLPLLIPVGLSIAVVHSSLATRSSRARIKLLEKDEKNSQKLIYILNQLEKQIGDVVADLIDDPGPESDASMTALEETESSQGKERVWGNSKAKPPPQQPIITPLQRKIAASLNKLPLKKKLAYIQGLRNSHAVIVCRDVKRFEGHRVGEGVIRHWAKEFEL